MIRILRSHERGRVSDGRIEIRHVSVPAAFRERRLRGSVALLSIDEYCFAPGAGTEMHRHHDAEIITCVIDGALEHDDGLNNGTIIFPGDIQRMSAGTGITHREFNASESEPVRMLQMAIAPERDGLVPSYEQRMFVPEESLGTMLLLASRDGRSDSVTIHRDADLYLCTTPHGVDVRHALRADRCAWVQVVRGSMMLGDRELGAGDGAGIMDEPEIALRGVEMAELLVLDMAW